jgi:hypothetical protein
MFLVGLKLAEDVECRKAFSYLRRDPEAGMETLLEAEMVNVIRRSKELYKKQDK